MREILFRAKTKMIVGTYNYGKEDGELVTGYLYCDVGKWIIRKFEVDRADYIGYEVDPETVCQYTGLTDKNGRKIFEGDIVKHFNQTEDNERYVIGYIKWNPDSCKFVKEKMDGVQYSISNKCIYEVIGNIFDDLELMKPSGGAEC